MDCGRFVGASGRTPIAQAPGRPRRTRLGKVKTKRNVLVIDVGGTNIKVVDCHHGEPIVIPSGPTMTARGMVTAVRKATTGWRYDVVSIGYPGPVVGDYPSAEPHHLGGGWTRLDFMKAFRCPIRIVNDASMQAMGNYEGGRMLYLGFGTDFGSALIIEGVLGPMELADLPYRYGRTYGDVVGARGLKRLGVAEWRRHVATVTSVFRHALQAEYVVLGGGNSMLITNLPRGTRHGAKDGAYLGGLRLWS